MKKLKKPAENRFVGICCLISVEHVEHEHFFKYKTIVDLAQLFINPKLGQIPHQWTLDVDNNYQLPFLINI